MKISTKDIKLSEYQKVKDPYHWVYWVMTLVTFLIFFAAVISSLLGADDEIVLGVGFGCVVLFILASFLKRRLPRNCPVDGKRMDYAVPPGGLAAYSYKWICRDHKRYIDTNVQKGGTD